MSFLAYYLSIVFISRLFSTALSLFPSPYFKGYIHFSVSFILFAHGIDNIQLKHGK